MKKCLIIGGNGFIGQNLIKGLTNVDDLEIRVFDLYVDNIVDIPNLVLFQKNLRDKEALDIAMSDIDIVYYLVSTTNVISSVANFEDNVDNIKYLKMCLNSMVANNVKKIVFASSGGTIYGEPNYLPIDEQHSTDPISPYGIIKLAMEKYLLYYKKQYGITPLILRYSNPFGFYSSTRTVGAIDIFCNKIINNKPIDIYGDPDSIIRDYIDIDDLVDYTIQLSLSEKTNHLIYNIGSSLPISLLDIIKYFEELFDKKANLNIKDFKTENVNKVVLDTSLIQKEIKVNLRGSINDLLRDKYSNLKELKN